MSGTKEIPGCQRREKLWTQIIQKRNGIKKCRNPYLLDRLARELFALVEKLEGAKYSSVAKELYIFCGQQVFKAQNAFQKYRLSSGNLTNKKEYLDHLKLIAEKIDDKLFSLFALNTR